MGEKTLKEKTFSGLSWSAVDKLFQQLFVFISGVLLARTLGREIYGLIGVLTIFAGMANILQESGFTASLIRKKDITESDYTTVFYSNITIGFILYIVLFVSAPLISSYYEQPVLAPLARFLFLSFLFNSFATIQNAKLLKEINYKLIAKISFVSILISYSTALSLTYLGYGVWALASQIVVNSLLRTILLWVFGKWKPTGSFSYKILKEFFPFSSKLALSSILNTFSTNIPQNIIGKQYSLGLAGLYNQASRLFNTISDFLAGTIQSVPFTVLSHITEDRKLKQAARKFVRAKAFIIFPVFMGMILVSNSFVVSLLGSEWLGSVPILQILCVGGFFSSLDNSNNDILKIKGKSGILLFFDIFRNILVVIVIIIVLLLKANYLYIVAGLSLCNIIKYIFNSLIANKMINYTLFELFKDQLPYFTTALFTIICGYLLSWIISNQFLLMICQIILVSIMYISILHTLGSVIVKETFKILISTLHKIR